METRHQVPGIHILSPYADRHGHYVLLSHQVGSSIALPLPGRHETREETVHGSTATGATCEYVLTSQIHAHVLQIVSHS